MKVPLSWLKEYVAFDDTIEGVIKKLTFSGLEVEGVETVGLTAEGGIVGEILKVWPHPNADKLRMCTVSTGSEEVQVVCGAPNVREGMKAAFCPIGATLKDGEGEFKLKPAKIRGEKSFGMLCAEDELGLGAGHDGILELDVSLKTGTPLAEVLGEPDTVFDIEVTPNRSDCLSVIGIARELAALYGSKLQLPDLTVQATGPDTASLTSVDVQDTEGCPRYTARVLQGLTIGPAPEWMQQRLKLSGIRPINNVVDITNYVLLEWGHPLHAFDFDLLAGKRIVVRRATDGEKMKTLDGEDRELTTENLVICDAEKSIALAGVMGGADSEIHDGTTDVLLEAATFLPSNVRSVAAKLNLHSESSYRFARGVNAVTVEQASLRAAQLLVQHAGATLAAGSVDAWANPGETPVIQARWKRIDRLIGITIPRERIRELLESIELVWQQEDDEGFSVGIPPFRLDLEREADLIEEVARLNGLDEIPARQPRAELVEGAEDHRSRALKSLRDTLVGLGLNEIVNYSMTSSRLLDLLDPEQAENRLALPHPMTSERGILRTSLIPQMVETLGRNKAHQVHEAALFEVGKVFGKEGDERQVLCLGIFGPVQRANTEKRNVDSASEAFQRMRGLLDEIFRIQGIGSARLKPAESAIYEAGTSIDLVLRGKPAGRVGVLKTLIAEEWRLAESVVLAEIDIDALLSAHGRQQKMQAIAPYPSTSRDAAVIVDRSVRHEEILKVINKAAPKELEEVTLFDVFEGEKLGANRKSLAYNFVYRSRKGTLTDEEANGFHEKIKDELRKSLQAEISAN